MMLFLLIAVQVAETRWNVLLACPKVSSPGVADGTGVVIGIKDDHAYVLTAAHVAQGTLAELMFSSRANYPKPAWFSEGAEVVARWPDPDIALIRFPHKKRDIPILPLAPAWERPKVFPVAALTVGVGKDRASTAVPDVVVAKEFVRRAEKGPAFFWRTRVPPEQGRSGGPLLDAQGRVIGIAAAYRGGAGYYAHHDEIVAALKRDGYGWLIEKSKQ